MADDLHLPAALPDISAAKLPASYEHAKTALSECSRIDECMDWANKAEALASYARQAEDDELRRMADRIQARAIRRCGELMEAIEPAKNQHDANSRAGAAYVGALSCNTASRSAAAKAAGLSEHQKNTALRVARIPEPEFTRQVESPTPPTVTALAEQGKKPAPMRRPVIDLEGIPADDFPLATHAGGVLKEFAAFCTQHDPVRVARAFLPREGARMKAAVSTVDAWLDRFVVNLRE